MIINFYNSNSRVFEDSTAILDRNDEIPLMQFKQKLSKLLEDCESIKLVLKKAPTIAVSVSQIKDVKDIVKAIASNRRYFGDKIKIVYLAFSLGDNNVKYATFSNLDESTKTIQDIKIKTIKQSEFRKVKTEWGLGKAEDVTEKSSSNEDSE